MAEAKSQPAWRSVTAMQADFAALILWRKATNCALQGSGMPLPYNGVCGRRECTEICRCATGRRGRRPLQRTAGSLGKFSAFRLPRAFLSCQIQTRYKNRTGSFGWAGPVFMAIPH